MKNNLTFVILLLLVFISQETVAFAKTCQMKTETSSPMKMEHRHSKEAMQLKEAKQLQDNNLNETSRVPDCCAHTVDCCANAALGNHCSMSCSVILALPNFIFHQTAFMASEAVEHPDSILLSLIPSSLYRPPILA